MKNFYTVWPTIKSVQYITHTTLQDFMKDFEDRYDFTIETSNSNVFLFLTAKKVPEKVENS